MLALKNNSPATHLCTLQTRTVWPVANHTEGPASLLRTVQIMSPTGATLTTVPARARSVRRDPRDGPRVEPESLEVRCVRIRF